MKKLLILALLIASVTFIFAIESDFSEIVGYVKYDLTANDYNLIALPMDSGLTTTSELAQAISPDVTSISVWDSQNQTWQQHVIAENGVFNIQKGDALLVHLQGTSNVEFYSTGSLADFASYDIPADDYAMMMIPLNRTEIVSASQLATAIGDGVTSISTWDNISHTWKQFLIQAPATDFELNPSDGVMIHSNTQYDSWNTPAVRSTTSTRTRVRK